MKWKDLCNLTKDFHFSLPKTNKIDLSIKTNRFFFMPELPEDFINQKSQHSKVKSENIQDLGSYGIDVENELSSMLSEEIAKSIDKEIISQILQSHRNSRRKKSKSILDKIKQMKEKGI